MVVVLRGFLQFVMLHLLHLCMALVQGQLIWPFPFNFFILLTLRYDAYTVVIWTLFLIACGITCKLTFKDLNI